MDQLMFLLKVSYLRAALVAALTLISLTLMPAQTHAQRKEDVYSRQYIAAIMNRVYKWQISNPVEANQRNSLWARAAFYTGIMAAYSTTHRKEYLQQALSWSEGREWKLGDRPRHADDHSPGQTYLELYLLKKEPGDKNYIGKLNPNGKKTFWARGNGWVMAGTVRVLQYLPKNNQYRSRYVTLLRTMAASVSRLQGEDGLWRPSLLDPQEVPVPETSGSGFFCYAIARGINQGYLDRKTYLPVVKKAWHGLVGVVRPDGKLGYVQPIGASPAKLTSEDNQEYGSGAFLLAGSEMYRLK